MKIVALLLAVATVLLPSGAAEDRSLVSAIEAFNAQSKHEELGATQPPLTVSEVVAAIRIWEKTSDAIPEDRIAAFKKIAQTNMLPEDAEFEFLTSYDRGDFVFDMWSIRIVLQNSDGSSHGFSIREQVLNSRTLEEELQRLRERLSKLTRDQHLPGMNRLTARVVSLERRIEQAKIVSDIN